MKEINEEELKFVAKSYKEGRLNIDNAWKKYSKQFQTVSNKSYRRIVTAASITLIAGIALACGLLAGYHYGVFPTGNKSVNTIENNMANAPQSHVQTDSLVLFRFENEPINIVLKEISNHFGTELYANDTTKNVTGEFEVQSVEDAINILENTLNIKIGKK